MVGTTHVCVWSVCLSQQGIYSVSGYVGVGRDCLSQYGFYCYICVCQCERGLSKSVWNVPTVFVYVSVRRDCLR